MSNVRPHKVNDVILRGVGTYLAMLIGLPSIAFAGDAACGFLEPPPSAGEVAFSTATTSVSARVYPRLSDIPANYSGCQVLWATINGNKTRTVVYLKEGRVESTDPAPKVPLCAKGEKTNEAAMRESGHCKPRSLQAAWPRQ
jgi:hypothetical protein